MQEKSAVDQELLKVFERDVLGKMPHVEGSRVVNPTPLVDFTGTIRGCAKEEYMLDLDGKRFSVYGKLEGSLLGGSIKSRPAVQIAHEAIRSGRLRRGMVVFEATSGNFGISLGLLGNLGFKVVVLVSRRLQEGVLEALQKSNVKTVDLDVDVCPAPGIQMDPNVLLAKVVATNMRERFSEIGLDLKVFDEARAKIEESLARQDVINLAKVLAKAYSGFCPEQYDNEENVRAHATVTGPEIEQQLRANGASLGDYQIVCSFGTGGTSGGLSRYAESKYGKKLVHVVFPPEGQDVAGIRTKATGAGLRFYEPARYAGEHEVDFGQAKRLFAYFVRKGIDVGESSALALYAVLQMINFGGGGRYVVILADGSKKYKSAVESEMKAEDKEEGIEVTLERAKARADRYDEVVWTHMGYVPTEAGRKLIAEQLGVPEASVKVASPSDVTKLVAGHEVTPGLKAVLDGGGKAGRMLLVCMAGNTSLRAAKALEEKGIKSQSLTGGITLLAQEGHKPLPTLVTPSR